MERPENIFVVVPCYNEKEVIRKTILSLLRLDKGLNIVLVDDASTQDIWEEIKDLSIFYTRHFINLGQGAALQTGMDFAYQNDADIVVCFDADGQHRAEEIEKLVRAILDKECDLALGSRFLDSTYAESVPFYKKIILKGAKLIDGMMSGLWLSDSHNGFRAFNRKALGKIKLSENRMAHATELLILIKKNNLSIKEIPVHLIYSTYSKSKGQSLWNSINILIDLIKNKCL